MSAVTLTLNYLMKRVYYSSPVFVLRTYKSAYLFWARIRAFWLPVSIYRGAVHNSTTKANFVYIGWNEQIAGYWLSFVFQDYEKVSGHIKIPVWKLKKFVKGITADNDLVMVEMANRIVSHFLRNINGFDVPRWLKTYIDIKYSLAYKRRVKEICRLNRKNAFTFEKAVAVEDFDFFYHRMYEPYIKSRYRETAVIEKYKPMLKEFTDRNSVIYFLLQNGSRIAGMYVGYIKGVPHGHALGVLDGSSEILKSGVTAPLYYFALEEHYRKGENIMTLGGTSPFLNDGLTRFKLSLRAKISDVTQQDSIMLKIIPSGTDEIRKFLKSNPFVFMEDKKMFCAVFSDEIHADSQELNAQENLYYDSNLAGIRFFTFNKENSLTELI